MNTTRSRTEDTDYFSAPNAFRLLFGLTAAFFFGLAAIPVLTQPTGLAYVGFALLAVSLSMPRR